MGEIVVFRVAFPWIAASALRCATSRVLSAWGLCRFDDEIVARTPGGRWGQAEEAAGTAAYLAGRASNFVTGETIRVDGGYAIK